MASFQSLRSLRLRSRLAGNTMFCRFFVLLLLPPAFVMPKSLPFPVGYCIIGRKFLNDFILSMNFIFIILNPGVALVPLRASLKGEYDGHGHWAFSSFSIFLNNWLILIQQLNVL